MLQWECVDGPGSPATSFRSSALLRRGSIGLPPFGPGGDVVAGAAYGTQALVAMQMPCKHQSGVQLVGVPPDVG